MHPFVESLMREIEGYLAAEEAWYVKEGEGKLTPADGVEPPYADEKIRALFARLRAAGPPPARGTPSISTSRVYTQGETLAARLGKDPVIVLTRYGSPVGLLVDLAHYDALVPPPPPEPPPEPTDADPPAGGSELEVRGPDGPPGPPAGR